MDQELGLERGTIISSNKGKYVIHRVLGEGGFGVVLSAHDEKNEKLKFAIKVEKVLETRRHSKLKMEIAILTAVQQLDERFKKHFVELVDRGKKPNYYFIVMELVGDSLSDMKKQLAKGIYSVETGLRVGIECLDSIEGLHRTNFIHRDIKPSNFARGKGNKDNVVYMLDFGMCRMFKTKDVKTGKLVVKTPRKDAGFKGTVRFAPLAAHRFEELATKDDMESWLYMILDLILANGLAWKKLSDNEKVFDKKLQCRNNKRLMFGTLKFADELDKMLKYLDSLNYVDELDYQFLNDIIKDAARKYNIDIQAPFEWQSGSSYDVSGFDD